MMAYVAGGVLGQPSFQRLRLDERYGGEIVRVAGPADDLHEQIDWAIGEVGVPAGKIDNVREAIAAEIERLTRENQVHNFGVSPVTTTDSTRIVQRQFLILGKKTNDGSPQDVFFAVLDKNGTVINRGKFFFSGNPKRT
jgi:hypothetical protein